MTDLKARKEAHLARAPLDDFGAGEARQWVQHAAKLIQLYETEREFYKAKADSTGAEFIERWNIYKQSTAALNAAWAEILGGEDGE